MIPLLLALFHHVTFDGLKPTRYTAANEALAMAVDTSASFLFQPFDAPRPVKSVSFRWRLTSGKIEGAGDDAYVRIGLMLAGDAPMIPFFAPSWIKAVHDVAKLPSDRLTFVLAGSRRPPGASWPSPRDDRIELHAAETIAGKDGWNVSTHAFPRPLTVVGLWIMADGDDTHARYDAELRDLRLE